MNVGCWKMVGKVLYSCNPYLFFAHLPRKCAIFFYFNGELINIHYLCPRFKKWDYA